MSQDDWTLAGLSLDEATERVVAADPEADPERVRQVLDGVTDDGGLAAAAYDETMSDASKYLSTTETRTELAESALEEAREAAAPVAEVETVAARLAAFEDAYAGVESRVAGLRDRLQAALGRPDDAAALYERVEALHDVASEADETAAAADRLADDLEAFAEWVDSQTVRFDRLDEDLDGVEWFLDGLDDSVAVLRDALEADQAVDPGQTWADAVLRHRVVGLLLDDVRAELADLRDWPGGSPPEDRATDAADRIEAAADRRAAAGEALTDLAEPSWRADYGDDVASFEAALEDHEPPVDWGAVQATLDAHRPEPFRSD